jgi:hypothetical protein
MTTSDERCSTPAPRSVAHSEHGKEPSALERRRTRAPRAQSQGLILETTGIPVPVTAGAVSQGPSLEGVELSRLAEVLRRGPSVVGAVVGRARLQGEVTHHLGCSALTAERLVDAMIRRGLIRQEVHRDGWVHWVVAVSRCDG